MKRLLILTIVAVLTVASSGCRSCGGLFNRGPSCETCPSGPYGAASPYGAAAPLTVPGETYLPAPG